MSQLYLNRAQYERIRDGVVDRGGKYRDRNELLVVLQTDLGLRGGELVKLRRENLDISEGTVFLPESIQKGNYAESITVEIDPYREYNTMRLLKRYIHGWWSDQDSEWLFPSREGGHISLSRYRKLVRDVCQVEGIRPRNDDGELVNASEANTHMFRHTSANLKLKSDDWGIYDVSKRLRHSSVTTTEEYYSHLQVV